MADDELVYHSTIFKELKNTPPVLTSDEELIERLKAGDAEAGNKLFLKHHRMILKVIFSITSGKWFDDDCFSAGAVGLFEAAKRFKPELGFKFLTYAVPWIRKYVYIEARNSLLPAAGVAFSRDFKERVYRYIGFKMMGMPDYEIQDRLGVSDRVFEKVKLAVRLTSRPSALTEPKIDDTDGSETEAPVEGLPSTISAEDEYISDEAIQRYRAIVETIPDEVSKRILNNLINCMLDVEGTECLTDDQLMETLRLSKHAFLAQKRKAYRAFRVAISKANAEERGQ